MKLTVVTWNISGGYTLAENGSGELNNTSDIKYFVEILRSFDADIICLQESHWHPKHSMTEEIAASLHFDHVFETIHHPSHIAKAKGYHISSVILSRIRIDDQRKLKLPHPNFSDYFPGEPKWDKHIQASTIQGIRVLNIHNHPIHLFGYDYVTDKGHEYAKSVEEAFAPLLKTPLLFAGDFNTDDIEKVFQKTVDQFGLKDALPNKPTSVYGSKTDHMLYSEELRVIESKIIKTNSDHYAGRTVFEV